MSMIFNKLSKVNYALTIYNNILHAGNEVNEIFTIIEGRYLRRKYN